MDNLTENLTSARPSVDPVDRQVYAWVLGHRRTAVKEFAHDLNLPVDRARASLERLVALRLVFLDPDDPDAGYAVAPELAVTELAAPVEARIRAEQEQLARTRALLADFAPVYQNSCGAGCSGTGVQVIASLPEVRSALNRASDDCTLEVLASQPGGGSRVPSAMEEALVRDRALLGRGVRMRTLYHHTARFNGPSQAYVAAASRLGGQYRTAHQLFGRLIVFDRELAFVPVQDGSSGAVAIREPSLVAYLCELFEHTWAEARPFADAADDGLEQVAQELDETILELLAAGIKDETIARRLGMSLRTTRRHIADIMQQLNAESRFQAGVAAVRAGLLPEERSADE
ncbi:helix-turn-helix domain-containing protein [Streptomyces sp. NRRL WC-3742]|uniref:helix-turn-helix domain-containing protein n=1 Tax=Streptomyces sp. NRRL WC-3742 TaxID=1463934 RepID=UPI0004CC025B|nr:helix-turn-helix domain-containing protein [Streptomyces sp. NRRL WC-3742]